MSILSIEFLVLAAGTLLVYFLLPLKIRWIALLGGRDGAERHPQPEDSAAELRVDEAPVEGMDADLAAGAVVERAAHRRV